LFNFLILFLNLSFPQPETTDENVTLISCKRLPGKPPCQKLNSFG
jgi:hypothetical protein